MQRLPCVSDECPLQGHHLSTPTILTQKALSLRRPEQ